MFERSRLGRSGRDPDEIEVVWIVDANDESGRRVREEVPVDPVAGGRYRVLATPGHLEGLAAGDVIELDEAGAATLVQRGGNVGVQIYCADQEPAAVHRLIDAAEDLGGWLDGLDPGRVLALTFPVGVGFGAIETLLDGYVAELADGGWMFTNVYERGSDTPLNWWE